MPRPKGTPKLLIRMSPSTGRPIAFAKCAHASPVPSPIQCDPIELLCGLRTSSVSDLNCHCDQDAERNGDEDT